MTVSLQLTGSVAQGVRVDENGRGNCRWQAAFTHLQATISPLTTALA